MINPLQGNTVNYVFLKNITALFSYAMSSMYQENKINIMIVKMILKIFNQIAFAGQYILLFMLMRNILNNIQHSNKLRNTQIRKI